jgi:hypothetical protein
VKSSVADPDDFGADPEPTFEKNSDLDPTPEKHTDPDPDIALCKIVYQLFVTRNFCLKMAYKTYF